MITLEIICVEASRKTIGPLLIEINSWRLNLKTRALELRTLNRNVCEGTDVSCWHEPDIPKYLGDVRCWVNSGKHVLALRFSGFDPKGFDPKRDIPNELPSDSDHV